jgi:hypothetical protein
MVWLGRCWWVWECQTGMLHWEIGELKTRVIAIKVLSKESGKAISSALSLVFIGFLHLGELVIDILDDSLNK